MPSRLYQFLSMNITKFENARCTSHAEQMIPLSPSEDTTFAKSLCTNCEHKSDCLELALSFDAQGIWGGTDQTERRAIAIVRSGK